jgi:hypothetical protein
LRSYPTGLLDFFKRACYLGTYFSCFERMGKRSTVRKFKWIKGEERKK